MRFAMVCASNNNRSMEAHLVFKNAEMRVSSYGVGGHVKLPGATQKSPNAYDFGTPYTEIHDDLQRQDAALYERNGLLTMLKRNISVRPSLSVDSLLKIPEEHKAKVRCPSLNQLHHQHGRRADLTGANAGGTAGEEGTGEVAARDGAVRRSSDVRGVGVR